MLSPLTRRVSEGSCEIALAHASHKTALAYASLALAYALTLRVGGLCEQSALAGQNECTLDRSTTQLRDRPGSFDVQSVVFDSTTIIDGMPRPSTAQFAISNYEATIMVTLVSLHKMENVAVDGSFND